MAENENDDLDWEFSRFLFRATGGNTSRKVSDLDLIDNMKVELDRLHAMAELLEYAQANPVPPGTSELLRDIWERASWILDFWSEQRGRKP